jgi:putative membrane protein
VLALSVAPALAQQSTPAKKANEAKTAVKTAVHSDNHFIADAAQGGYAEIELGKLAKDKASSSDVKTFADRMVSDHDKANDELKDIAAKNNVTWPTALDAKHKATYDRLSKLSGPAFDRAYMQAMLKDHQEDVAAFRTESKTGKDEDVKTFATKTLPTLEEHLKLAQTTNGAVATSGTKTK